MSQDAIVSRHDDEIRQARTGGCNQSGVRSRSSLIRRCEATDNGDGTYTVNVLDESGNTVDTLTRIRAHDDAILIFEPHRPIPYLFIGGSGSGSTVYNTSLSGYLGFVSE